MYLCLFLRSSLQELLKNFTPSIGPGWHWESTFCTPPRIGNRNLTVIKYGHNADISLQVLGQADSLHSRCIVNSSSYEQVCSWYISSDTRIITYMGQSRFFRSLACNDNQYNHLLGYYGYNSKSIHESPNSKLLMLLLTRISTITVQVHHDTIRQNMIAILARLYEFPILEYSSECVL